MSVRNEQWAAAEERDGSKVFNEWTEGKSPACAGARKRRRVSERQVRAAVGREGKKREGKIRTTMSSNIRRPGNLE